MFHQEDTPTVRLALWFAFVVVPKPPAAVSNHTPVFAQSAEPVLSPTFTSETRLISASIDKVNTTPKLGGIGFPWAWFLMPLIGISLLMWRVKKHRLDNPAIATVSSTAANSSAAAISSQDNTTTAASNPTERLLQVTSHHTERMAVVTCGSATDAVQAQKAALIGDAAGVKSSNLSDDSSNHPQLADTCETIAKQRGNALLSLRNGNATQLEAHINWAVLTERQIAMQQQGGQKCVLRVYDASNIDLDSQPAHRFWQYDCSATTQKIVISVPSADRHYVAEIGYLTDDGRLLCLARSPMTHIPHPRTVTSTC